jgi:prophage regulatory protein
MLNQKLVSKKELRSVYGIPYSFQHIARMEKAQQFPKRLQLGANRVAWLCSEVEDWINVRSLGRKA